MPKNVVFGGFEGEDVKILCSHPQKALPCMNMHLLVYCVSKSVQRPVKITTGVTSPHTASCHSIFKNFFLKVGGKILCTEKEIFKKLSGNWLYGEK